jgi:hypothetical protein
VNTNVSEAIKLALAELDKAEEKHPNWPSDPIHAAAIVAEVAGELVQASLDIIYSGGSQDRMRAEASQVAAVGLRFLANLSTPNLREPRVVGISFDGSGTWQRVDEDGNNKTTDTAYFNNHPTYAGIQDATIDEQAMVQIPKFYYKVEQAPAGSDQAGKKCWWISDQPAAGFELHPAFMDGGVEIDRFYVGKYEGTDDAGTKVGSAAGVSPLVSVDFTTMHSRCAARNAGGVEGFHMWNIHELSAIQMLALIELGTPDVQSAISAGNTNSFAAVNTGVSGAVWRGIHELWGNVCGAVDGFKTDTSNRLEVFDRLGNETYINTGTVITTSGWTTSMLEASGADWDFASMFAVANVDSAEGNGTFADYWYSNSAGSEYICYHGGNWRSGSLAGLFHLVLSYVASRSGTSFGCRLAKR